MTQKKLLFIFVMVFSITVNVFAKDYGVRLSGSLGLLPLYFGNEDMLDSWKASVPVSEDDELGMFNLALNADLSVKIYNRFSMGVFYGMFGPQINETLTYTTSGYWYYYYGVLYYTPAGSYDENWSLNFFPSSHAGLTLRYYFTFDEKNNSTWSNGGEAYVELCAGQTNLDGSFFKNSTEKLATFTGVGPYYHIGFGANINAIKNSPFFISFKARIPFGKVTTIKNGEGNIIYNSDGSKFSVEYTSIHFFNFGLGIKF